MDPAWYVGQISRGEAESCLRRVNRVRLCIPSHWNWEKNKCNSQVNKVNLFKCVPCKDGTFLVRDSSNRSSNQPYTLVVLYQEKVYNIQIRRFQNGFMLGTGMKSSEVFKLLLFFMSVIIPTCSMTKACNTVDCLWQTFERVGGIINQHKHTPLLLIDAKNRESSQQKQCSLIYPAGY